MAGVVRAYVGLASSYGRIPFVSITLRIVLAPQHGRQGSLRHEVGSGWCGNDQGPHVAPNPQKASRETAIRDGLTLRIPLIYILHHARELATNISTLRSSLGVLDAPEITTQSLPDYAHSRFAFSLSPVGLRQLYTFHPTTNITVHCHTFTMPVNLL